MSRLIAGAGRIGAVLLAGLVLAVPALSGCSVSGGTGAEVPGGGVASSRPAPPPRNALPSAGCPVLVSDPAAAQRAVETARPGERICLGGGELASITLRITASGTPGAPIQVLADGAQVYGIDVRANQVEVAGFTMRDGGTLSLRGGGLRAHHNNVLNATRNGILCTCSDSVVESNMVDGTDGVGISAQGERITVRDNTVSGSVRRDATDADGIRFFGHAIQISRNVVRDISVSGYPDDEAPHADCFQTFDSSAPPTYDVLISDNRCERVGVQCLTGSGKHGNPGVPPGMRSISFVRNFCDVGGAQAINLDGYPHVEIAANVITGPNLHRGIHLAGGSFDAVVTDNVMSVDKPVYQADQDSQPARADGNRVER